MEILTPVILIMSTLFLGAISPGPSFLLVARLSIGTSRHDGIAAALGMGVSGVILALLSLFGLHVLLTTIPTLYLVLKVLGGLYLIYLAYRIWQGANKIVASGDEMFLSQGQRKKSFTIGLATQVSNPKAAIVYGSVFAALLPPTIPLSLYLILPPAVFVMETGWYIFVSIVLSTSSPRQTYLRFKAVFDRLAGGVMAGLGIKLITSAGN